MLEGTTEPPPAWRARQVLRRCGAPAGHQRAAGYTSSSLHGLTAVTRRGALWVPADCTDIKHTLLEAAHADRGYTVVPSPGTSPGWGPRRRVPGGGLT